MTLFGWDTSDFDASRGPVDVAAAYRDGIRVFTHKLTEGTKVRHKNGPAKLAAARDLGMWCGGYQVPRTPGNGGHGTVAQQYDYLMAYVQANIPWWSRYPLWFWQVDLERWSNSTGVYDAVSVGTGLAMCDRLAATGAPVVLYAPEWAYGNTIGGSVPLWESQYGSNPAVPYRDAYAAAGGDASTRWKAYSGRTPLVLQFGSRTIIGGQHDCDANAIRDERAWKRLFSIPITEDIMATDAVTQKLNDIYEWTRAATTGRDSTGKEWRDPWDGAGPYGNRQIAEKVDAILEQLDTAPAGSGDAVDLDALAAKVAPLVVDQLFERIRQLIPGAGATPQQQS